LDGIFARENWNHHGKWSRKNYAAECFHNKLNRTSNKTSESFYEIGDGIKQIQQENNVELLRLIAVG
jgi:hypothetical protein